MSTDGDPSVDRAFEAEARIGALRPPASVDPVRAIAQMFLEITRPFWR